MTDIPRTVHQMFLSPMSIVWDPETKRVSQVAMEMLWWDSAGEVLANTLIYDGLEQVRTARKQLVWRLIT